jgi:hypothetical protein
MYLRMPWVKKLNPPPLERKSDSGFRRWKRKLFSSFAYHRAETLLSGLCFRLDSVILIRYRKTITCGAAQRNLFRPHSLAHSSPCGEGADLRAGDYRGAGTARLPAEPWDPVSPPPRIGTRWPFALIRATQRQARTPTLQGNCQGSPFFAGGEEQGP